MIQSRDASRKFHDCFKSVKVFSVLFIDFLSKWHQIVNKNLLNYYVGFSTTFFWLILQFAASVYMPFKLSLNDEKKFHGTLLKKSIQINDAIDFLTYMFLFLICLTSYKIHNFGNFWSLFVLELTRFTIWNFQQHQNKLSSCFLQQLLIQNWIFTT